MIASDKTTTRNSDEHWPQLCWHGTQKQEALLDGLDRVLLGATSPAHGQAQVLAGRVAPRRAAKLRGRIIYIAPDQQAPALGDNAEVEHLSWNWQSNTRE